MSRNIEFEMKRGASGAVITPTLSDANGAFDLTGFASVVMTASKGDVTVLDAVEMDIDPDQEANTGVVSYAFTAETADIVPDTYNLEFVGTDADGGVHVWPTDRTKPFGKLIVLERA
jgi:hypothetical protein